MIIRQFLQWMRTAYAAQRADATHALARVYLYSAPRGSGTRFMRPVSIQLFTASGFVLLCACTNTINLAPAAPDVPAPFPSSEEATITAAPAAVAPAKFSIPP